MNRWPETRTLEFVRTYRQHECLWNPRSPLYKNREARQAACQAMVSASQVPGFTVSDVKYKIKNLRSTYLQELKKIRASRMYIQSSGDTSAKVYKPGVIWFNDMKRVMRHTALDDFELTDEEDDSEQTLTGDDPLESITLEYQVDNEGDWKMKTEDEISGANSVIMAEIPQPGVWMPVEESSPELASIRNPRGLKPSSYQEMKRRINKKIIPTTSQTIEDEFHYFGLNIACQLRKLPLKSSLQLQLTMQRLLARERIAQSKRLARRNRRRLVTPLLPIITSSASTEELIDSSRYTDLDLGNRLLNTPDTC